MADETTDDKFVEIEGVKYKEDPEKEGEALLGEDEKPVLFEEKKEEVKPEEPQSRKSKKDFIIDRQQKKIKKLKKDKEGEGEGESEEEDEELSPEAEERIDDRVEKKIAPIRSLVRGTSDDNELKEVQATYAGAKDPEMEKNIRKYMVHPDYQNVAIEFIYLGLAAKKDKLAEKKKEADEEAEETKTTGHSRRPKDISKIPDVTKMNDKDFDDLVFKVKTGQE